MSGTEGDATLGFIPVEDKLVLLLILADEGVAGSGILRGWVGVGVWSERWSCAGDEGLEFSKSRGEDDARVRPPSIANAGRGGTGGMSPISAGEGCDRLDDRERDTVGAGKGGMDVVVGIYGEMSISSLSEMPSDTVS